MDTPPAKAVLSPFPSAPPDSCSCPPEAKERVDVCCFVVAADEVHTVGVLNLERQQQAHRLQAVAAPAANTRHECVGEKQESQRAPLTCPVPHTPM